MRLLDLAEMPNFNPGTGGHGLNSVSSGEVFWHAQNKVTCRDHGAMNAVNPDRTIWRCIHAVPSCGRGAFIDWEVA